MTVKEAAYHKPANAEGGLYILLTDLKDDDIRSGGATALAEETAYAKGYRAWGRRTVGMPVWDPAAKRSSQAFWFHEKGDIR